MPVRDPEKNKAYVSKHRAMMKANAETKQEYNKLNASYIENHRKNLKDKMGTDEYNKKNAEYMKQYRAKQKQAKQDIQNSKATTLQNAIRNKLARNALLRQKQNKANEAISLINQKKREDLIRKLNASVNANDMLNDLFPSILNQIPENKQRGRPRKYV